MFKKVLVDIEAIIHLPVVGWSVEQGARDLEDFLRDHRSRDNYRIDIRRTYENHCEFCGYLEDYDADGYPSCCSAAQLEWEATRTEVLS
uniref:Uncharacterized protein n=1 Tax=viral metagenome TaxID=1070528 RepID=A0A6M3XJ08_9ZZZZ